MKLAIVFLALAAVAQTNGQPCTPENMGEELLATLLLVNIATGGFFTRDLANVTGFPAMTEPEIEALGELLELAGNTTKVAQVCQECIELQGDNYLSCADNANVTGNITDLQNTGCYMVMQDQLEVQCYPWVVNTTACAIPTSGDDEGYNTAAYEGLAAICPTESLDTCNFDTDDAQEMLTNLADANVTLTCVGCISQAAIAGIYVDELPNEDPKRSDILNACGVVTPMPTAPTAPTPTPPSPTPPTAPTPAPPTAPTPTSGGAVVSAAVAGAVAALLVAAVVV